MQSLLISLLLQVQEIPDPTLLVKSLPSIIAGVTVALLTLGITLYRENTQNYAKRMKMLETTATNAQHQLKDIYVERKNIIEKYDLRFLVLENKSLTIDRLSQDVAKLSYDITHLTKSLDKVEAGMDKLDTKFDKIIDEFRKTN